jgi:hypothetical protein
MDAAKPSAMLVSNRRVPYCLTWICKTSRSSGLALGGSRKERSTADTALQKPTIQ